MNYAEATSYAAPALAVLAAVGAFGWLRQQSGRGAAEAQAAQLRRQLQELEPLHALRECVSEAVAWVAADGELTPLTASFARFCRTEDKQTAPLVWADLFAPGHDHRATVLLEALRAGNTSEGTVEFAPGRADAGVRWCCLTLFPAPAALRHKGLLVVLRDCTELQELRLRKDEFNVTLEGVEDAVVALLGDSDVIAWASPAFEALSGWPREQVRGRCLSDLLKSQPVDEPMPTTLELVASGGVWQGEFRSVTATDELLLERRRVYLVEDEANHTTRHVVVFRDLRRDLATQEHLQVLSQVDVATELPNLYGFLAALRTRLQEVQGASRLSVVHLDFHGCEAMRETQGTLAVDAGLRRISACLSRSLKDDNLLSRVGPAQLALVLPTVNLQAIESVLRAMTTMLSAQGANENTELYTAVSIGVAPGGEGVSPENLLHAAQLTSARLDPSSGVNLGYFSEQLQAEMSRRLRVESTLRDVLRDRPNELVLHFQPKVNPYRQSLVGFEALCRWKSSRLGAVSPAEFIPAAERTGLIIALGERTFEYACQCLADWRSAGLPVRPVAVNVSAHQLARETLANEFLAIAQRFDIAPRLLELEVTESAVMNDIDSAARLLKKLRSAGFAIALDDFGTGQSSLSYLRKLPLDALKIDRSFISDIETRADAAAICKSVLELGKTLHLKVVAEGVETPGQLDFLMQHQCDVIQGHVFSPAVPAQEASDMLNEMSDRVTSMMGQLAG